MFIQPVVEDILQEYILFKLFDQYRSDLNLIGALGNKGNSYIKQKLFGFNLASQYVPYVITTDLDEVDCAPTLYNEWFNFPKSDKLLFRIMVRESEAWLLADRSNFSKFIGVPLNKIPPNSEEIANPKEFLIALTRNSKKKAVRGLLPIGTSHVGPGYNLILQEFIIKYWNPEEARLHSPSLNKAIVRIREFLV